jgi:hypothetical protein
VKRNQSGPPPPKLWITYAWDDDAEGDFSYLVQELNSIGVDARYDKVALIRGQGLWDQIGEQIISRGIDGWAYLLTSNSLSSNACREELRYALYRALSDKGEGFPLIGLIHGVSISDVPPSLRVRICIDLAGSFWKEEVKSALDRRPPEIPIKAQMKYAWKIHSNFGGDPALTAIEVRPRFGQMTFWRFIIPKPATIAGWGRGPAGGKGMSGPQMQICSNPDTEWNGRPAAWFGSGDLLSPSVSAYVVFSGSPPQHIWFSSASEPFGAPTDEPERFDIG